MASADVLVMLLLLVGCVVTGQASPARPGDFITFLSQNIQNPPKAAGSSDNEAVFKALAAAVQKGRRSGLTEKRADPSQRQNFDTLLSGTIPVYNIEGASMPDDVAERMSVKRLQGKRSHEKSIPEEVSSLFDTAEYRQAEKRRNPGPGPMPSDLRRLLFGYPVIPLSNTRGTGPDELLKQMSAVSQFQKRLISLQEPVLSKEFGSSAKGEGPHLRGLIPEEKQKTLLH